MSYQKCGDNDASVATFVENFFLMLDNAALYNPHFVEKTAYLKEMLVVKVVISDKETNCFYLS